METFEMIIVCVMAFILCQYTSNGYSSGEEHSDGVFAEDIRDKIAYMDDVIRQQSQKIDALDDKVLAQEREINHLKGKLQDHTALCEFSTHKIAKGSSFGESSVKPSSVVRDESDRHNGLPYGIPEYSNQIDSQHIQKRNAETDHVAFSTYLDHWVHLDVGRIIKCNQILINDGNGYNKLTGIFTVPYTGTYFFTYSVCLHHIIVSVRLLRDGQIVSSLMADAGKVGKSGMSSNSAIIRVNAGQVLWIELFQQTNITLVSSDEWRCTTFSGFKLY